MAPERPTTNSVNMEEPGTSSQETVVNGANGINGVSSYPCDVKVGNSGEQDVIISHEAPIEVEVEEVEVIDPETINRQKRLKFLLEKSGVYAKLIGDRMEKQRQDRIEKEFKAAVRATKGDTKKDEKVAATKEAKKAVTVETKRTSARTAGKKVDEPAMATTTSSSAVTGGKRKRGGRTSGRGTGTDQDQKDQEQEKKKPETKEEPTVVSANTGETSGPNGTYIGQQPALITGTKLRDYQLAGVQWMVSLYENGLNGILADEMGLGKTLQTISFLAYLMGKGAYGPYLVVCPLSVLANWVTEFAKFAPTIPVLMYHGTPTEREEMRQKHLQPFKAKKPPSNFPVIVTTYDMVIIDKKYLGKLGWKFIVVDEGHRLKNLNCKLVQELKSYKSANRLLLTGTPLHNNLSELWSLLNFILPDIFDDLETFREWFNFDDLQDQNQNNDGINRGEIVTSLHNILKPFLLRRLKVDVEPNLPKKKEYVLYAPLTQLQNEMYRAIVNRDIRSFLIEKKTGGEGWSTPMTEATDVSTVDSEANSADAAESRNGRSSRRLAKRPKIDYNLRTNDDKWLRDVDAGRPVQLTTIMKQAEDEKSMEEIGREYALKKATTAVNNMKLQNVIMQLRKVSNHPWLFDWPSNPETGDLVVNEDLIHASGKMLLLRRLLDALFQKGHKVLIFSQFTTMLDIIEDWATEFQGWKVFRIDGSTSQPDRLSQMSEFNTAGDSPDACRLFLLSTRAGGLGINLVAADTVIFFDQDWNPQADLQAADRAHRIGQTKPVLVLRLVSAQTIESKILQKAGMKRKLEALVISKGKFQHVDKNGQIVLGREAKNKATTIEDISKQLLELDSEEITVVSKDDKIISDEDLEILLDRSDEAFSRGQGWSNSLMGQKKVEAAKKGEKTAFEVFVPAKDDTNDGLAHMFGEEEK